MRRLLWFLILGAFAGISCSCDGDNTPPDEGGTPDTSVVVDAGTVDTGPDDPRLVDAGPDDTGPGDTEPVDAPLTDTGPSPARSTVHQSSGGGRAASANFQVRIMMGPPQPMGKATSATHRVIMGPAAVGP